MAHTGFPRIWCTDKVVLATAPLVSPSGPATEHDSDSSSTSQRHATYCPVFAAGRSCATSPSRTARQFHVPFLDADQEARCACALARYASEANPNAKNVRKESRDVIRKYIKRTHTHTYVWSPSSIADFKKSGQFTST